MNIIENALQQLRAMPIDDNATVGLILVIAVVALATALISYVRSRTVMAAEPAPRVECSQEGVRRMASALHIVAGEIARTEGDIAPAQLRQLARLSGQSQELATCLLRTPTPTPANAEAHAA